MSSNSSFLQLSSQALYITLSQVPLREVRSLLQTLPKAYKDKYLIAPFDEKNIEILINSGYLNNEIRPLFSKYAQDKKKWSYQIDKDLLSLPHLRELHFKIESLIKKIFSERIEKTPSLFDESDWDHLMKLAVSNDCIDILQQLTLCKFSAKTLGDLLVLAVDKKSSKALKALLEPSVSPLISIDDHNRALFRSVSSSNKEALTLILENSNQLASGHAFQMAAERGNIECLQQLFLHCHSHPFSNFNINEAFIYAAAEGHGLVIDFIKSNIGLAVISTRSAEEAICMASHAGHQKLVLSIAEMKSLDPVEVIQSLTRIND